MPTTANLNRLFIANRWIYLYNAAYIGELTTKPFTFTGNELEINYSTSAPGKLGLKIQDEDGNTHSGLYHGRRAGG